MDEPDNSIMDGSGNYLLSLTENVVNVLLDDEQFVADCKSDLDQIMKDGKFDFKDMPQVISLVVSIYTKYDKLDINEEDIAEAFRLLIIALLKKFNMIEESNFEIESMLDSCLTLLVMKVKTKSFWSKYFGWCVCKCCIKSSCCK
tara:strand:- start:411 stop:845 length:435 start_codon:yes stop_codon:yes gene_type:complete